MAEIIDFIAVFVYMVLFVFSIIGSILYIYAYNNMKHSKIIRSVAILFVGLSIDSLWWIIITMYNMHVYGSVFFYTQNYIIVLIKIVLIIGVIKFVVRSIRTDNSDDSLSDSMQVKLF